MLVILPVVAIDLQFAAMPDIARAMDASVAAVQGTLSAFAGVFGFLQLVYGPVSDRLGRKPLIVGGMVLFGLASIGAVLSDTIAMLTAMRVLQAIGACAGPVLGRAAIRDVHGGQGAARMLGYLMGAFGILAILGPLLGGVLVDAFDWRASFIGMAIFGFVAAALCWLLLPETRPETNADPTGANPGGRAGKPSPRALVATFAKLLGTRQILVFVVTGGLMQGAFFAWLAGSSFVIMKVFGYSGTAYGLILPITVAGFVGASFLAGRLAGRVALHRLVVPGVLAGAVGGFLGLALALAGENALWAVLAPIVVVALGHGMTLSQTAAGAMAPYPEHAGAASALAGFFQYLGIMASVALTGLVFDGTVLPILALIAGFAGAATLVYLPNARVIAARMAR
jgi:DHA1 family bicyclomycin/chloramphenicol resistance-like MFS transporter